MVFLLIHFFDVVFFFLFFFFFFFCFFVVFQVSLKPSTLQSFIKTTPQSPFKKKSNKAL